METISEKKMSKQTLKDILGGIVLVIFVLTFLSIIMNALNTPEVYVSNATGKCVDVMNYVEGDNYTCENMPSKYTHIWVR
jgi:hypothetical protein